MNKEQLKEYLNNKENWKLFEELVNSRELYLLPTADLRYANLGNANLWNVNLKNAHLGNANLKNADLEYANLGSANLENADLECAHLWNADLGKANLGDRKVIENE